ncbi:hypothetical protein BJV77DRAFT_960890 [Russula vinacea]|nr:hypothetical protein BJV77DRAFT_960890 [Russula vinacea]
MIIFSEIGDKTFLIAAILAMRHPRIVVFAGHWARSCDGPHPPHADPKRWTQLAAGVLFLVFGAKLFVEGKNMPGGNEKVLEEMREAEEEINEDVAEHDGTGRVTATGDVIPLEEIEAGGARPVADGGGDGGGGAGERPKSASAMKGMLDGTRNLCSFLLGPVFVQVFVLTFLGEWGDRSQIATIMLAAAHNVYIVALGTIIGHTFCTALAVIAGRYVSTRISAKHVTLGGAVLFLCFGLIYLYEAGQSTDFDPQDHIPRG